MRVLEAGSQMGDADGEGSEWRALVEAATGRAGQANCTLLTASRFLTAGDGGGGGAPKGIRQPAPYCAHSWAAQGWKGKWILCTLQS